MVRKFLWLFVLIGMVLGLKVVAQEKHRLLHGWEFVQGDLGDVWEGVRPVANGAPETLPIWENVVLPHSYNATDAVHPEENYYQGPAWYRTYLDIENPYIGGRTILHFEGAGQKSEVYVYQEKVGEHVGGYDEWYVDITDAVKRFYKNNAMKRFKGRVPILIRTDNSRDVEMIPSDLSDFNVYGGLYRYVNLCYVPTLSTRHLFADAKLNDNGKEGMVTLRAQFWNPNGISSADVHTTIKDQSGKIVAQRHTTVKLQPTSAIQALGDIGVPRPNIWSPDAPFLYTVEVAVIHGADTAVTAERIGFRSFEFVRSGPFKLNGKRLLLRGTHRHEDHAGVGPAMTEEQIWEEMRMMKDMGVNFIRLGHYQQSRIVLDACDSLGILVWEEIPWCRGGLGGAVYQQQAKRMLTNMIQQHFNHPSIIIWGLGNENDWPGDFDEFDQEKIRAFMKELHDLSHQLDDSRKTAIRRCDFCKDIVDVYSPSIWAGWYRGVYTDYKTASRNEFERIDHFLHVEWGGDSHAGRHSETPDAGLSEVMGSTTADERAGDASLYGGPSRVSKDGDWSESYMVNLIDWHLKEQETMPWLTGTAYWPFKDFSTPIRPENPVPYMNQKGVVARDFKKKESYYVFQSYWAEKPMIHIYGHSWPVRWGDEGQERMIKVYSNCQEVELFLNGESLGKRKRDSQDFPAAGLRWMVKFKTGENKLEAIGYKNGQTIHDMLVQEYQIERWGKPVRVALEVLEEQEDTLLLKAQLFDENGVRCLDASNYINFEAVGEGKLLVDQGTSDGSRRLQAYNGRAIVRLVRAGKNVVVTAHADSLNTFILDLSRTVADVKVQVSKRIKVHVLKAAEEALSLSPLTITSSVCPRSAGGKHDFYSEGDYWWPDPKNPEGPYIRKDGLSNPDNFVDHRNLVMRLGDILGTLVSAWELTRDVRYLDASLKHVEAWFINSETRMNPAMEYAQAIKGIATGRGIGIIDGIHLVEVARALQVLHDAHKLPLEIYTGTKSWFSAYLGWITTHPYGLQERDTKNNHAACWVLQVAAFAQYVGDEGLLDFAAVRYKTVLLPDQMADNGSFPLELERTKPYGYSLFNLDVFSGINYILKEHEPNLPSVHIGEKSLKKGIQFMVPYVEDKTLWHYGEDVMYWNNWPIAHPFLLLGCVMFEQPQWLHLWGRLPLDYSEQEVRRNSPIRHPLLWM
ncbi:alginate lyase family protein [Sphingobacterium sp. DN00404]|uniref:Alginate lyase family protein n=1 Tax=Sphingobacterium micropteri TaxID=2763501 RepID=A0ABR7YL01_9SPHI|nr:alginate lyase family protein [Sphingobacterium micropteri]MBD1431993.1 alginate lyase family protein [Sphingobacterium micropteri]